MGCTASSATLLSEEVPAANSPRPDAGAWLRELEALLVKAEGAGGAAELDLEALDGALRSWLRLQEKRRLEGAWISAGHMLALVELFGRLVTALAKERPTGKSCLETDAGFRVVAQLCQILAAVQARAALDPTSRVVRVGAGWGWALHGLVFELADGRRLGDFLASDGSSMDLLSDSALRGRGCTWMDLEPGERIVSVSGCNCLGGYLAYSVSLQTNKGRSLDFSAHHEEWQRGCFRYAAPAGHEVEVAYFHRGRCEGLGTVPACCWSEEERASVSAALARVCLPSLQAMAAACRSRGAAECNNLLIFASDVGLADQPLLQEARNRVWESLSMPSYWDLSAMGGVDVDLGPHGSRKNLWGQVQLEDSQLAGLQHLFDATVCKRYTRDRKNEKVPDKLELVRGFRIQNSQNWAEFLAASRKVKKDLEGLRAAGEKVLDSVPGLKTSGALPAGSEFELEEGTNSAWLFHGTAESSADAIVKGLFRMDRAGSNAGTLLGRGIYLAESCSKADEYSRENRDKLRCMLLCRAVLGNVAYCDRRQPDVPALVQSCVKGPCHSVLGDREKINGTFREFVLYERDQVYPEYIVWYRRVYDDGKADR